MLYRLLRCLFCWGTPTAEGNLNDAQIILTQANSELDDASSSDINIALACDARGYHKQLGLPIFAQGEVATVLKGWKVPLIGETRLVSTYALAAPGRVDTHEVATLQNVLCRRLGYTRIIPIAPMPHLWRTIWVYQKLGLTVIVPPEVRAMIYQKNLTSTYWRTPLGAHCYELGARLYYLYKGYI